MVQVKAWRLALQDAGVRLGAWSVLLLSISLVAAQGLSAAWVAVFAGAVLAAADAFEPLSEAAQRIGATRAAAARMWSIGDEVPALEYSCASASTLGWSPSLTMQHVSFNYPHVSCGLSDINLYAAPGCAVAVVGPSGAGKSTVLLLAAPYEATSGNVLAHDKEVRSYSARDLAGARTPLTHDPFIFSGSVRDNLHLGAPDADDVALRVVLMRLGLDLGLDTWLGDGGARPSGGERQRLGFARVLLGNQPVVLLDEPTTHLDPASAASMMAILRELSRTRAIVLATHRLRDLHWVAEVVVLDGGRIAERGSHAQLHSQGGLFQHLFEQDALLDLSSDEKTLRTA